MWQYNQTPDTDELMHYGILGMKWGKRRYQNKDGSLTPDGKKRYNAEKTAKEAKKTAKTQFRSDVRDFKKGRFYANMDVDTKTGKISNAKFYNAKGERVTQEYVDRIVASERNRKILTKSLVGLAVVGTGALVCNKVLNDASYEINGRSVDRKEFFNVAKGAIKGMR